MFNKKKKVHLIMSFGILLVLTLFNGRVWAQTNPIPDETSDRKITITKYQTKELNANDGEGDGTEKTPTTTTEILQGVIFQLQKVQPINNGKNLTDPTEQILGKDYNLTGETKKATTDSNGQAVFDLGKGSANDGLYLITEIDSSDAVDASGKKVTVTTPSKPFFAYVPQTSRGDQAGLIYDVHVQPKNTIENALNPQKTVNGSSTGSVVSGNDFEWELISGIPTGLYTIADKETRVAIVDKDGNQLYNDANGVTEAYMTIQSGQPIYIDGVGTFYNKDGDIVAAARVANFSMIDVLNSGLSYKVATVWIENASGWTQISDENYTISYDDNSNKVTMDLTENGIKELGLGTVTAKDGNKVEGPFSRISTRIITNVDESFNGSIENTFDVKYQTPGSKPVTQNPDTKPKFFTGGFQVEKQDETTKSKLTGAEFSIALSENDAKNGKYLATDGKTYTVDNLPSNVSHIIAISDSIGIATFNGLPLDFTDGNGNEVLDIDDNGLPTSGDQVQRNYFVVETKAPKGYELLTSPQLVTVTLDTKEKVQLIVNDKKSTILPFTGGTGTTVLILIALSTLVIGTLMITIYNKKQEN